MVEKQKDKEIDSFLRGAEESRKGGYEGRYKEDDFRGPKKMGGNALMGAAFLVFLLLVVAGVAWIVKSMKDSKGGPSQTIIERTVSGPSGANMVTGEDGLKYDQAKYQAVFLTNGQVYFGKMASHNLSYIELTDIYYLQVKPVLQQGEGENSKNNQAQQQTELSLVKLGNELHGPQDRMMLNKDQVVFIEDLKDDSKVTDAIKRYQQEGNKQPAAGEQAQPSQQPAQTQPTTPSEQPTASNQNQNQNQNSKPTQGR